MEHDYFGYLDEDASGGLYWSESLELGDTSVTVDLVVDDAPGLGAEQLDLASGVLLALEGLDSAAREHLVGELSDPSSPVAGWIDEVAEELGDELDEILEHRSGDRAIDVLRSLVLTRVSLRPELGGSEESFATFEYTLDADTDSALAVHHNASGEVVTVESL